MLTKKQKKIFDVIVSIVRNQGYFPTVREIGKLSGLSSPATVHSYLHRLFDKGHLRRSGRTWELVADSNSIPLAGIVPAGSPLEVFESLGEEIDLPEWMVEKGGDVIAFRVQGDSMKDAFIQEGDVVVVKQMQRAESGEMIVALLEDSSITLKRLKRQDDRYLLVAENPDYKPIYDPFQVVGKVVAVLRKYR